MVAHRQVFVFAKVLKGSNIDTCVVCRMPNISARIVSQLVQFVRTAFPQM